MPSYTRNDVQAVCERVNEEEARQLIRFMFADPANIGLFGWFCFPEACGDPTPRFHEDIWNECNHTGYKAFAAPRGMAKSTAINLVYHAWLISQAAKHCIVQISDTFTQAAEQVALLAHQLQGSEMYHWLYGDPTTEKWSGHDFVTKNDCRVIALGAGMKIRGLKHLQWRPDLITLDDIENDELVTSSDRRRKLKRWFSNAVLPALAPGGEVIIIGTILHNDSLLANAVNKRNEFAAYRTRLYKAINTEKATGRQYSRWPQRFPLVMLERMRSDPSYEGFIGSLAFAQEMQNEPFSEEDAIIKPAWIQWVDERPYNPQLTAIGIDPAISQKETADYTGKVAVDFTRDKKIVVWQIDNARLDFPQNVESIKQWDKQIKPSLIVIEDIAFQAAFQQVLWGLPVVGLKPDKDKRRRVLSTSPFFEAGKIQIVRSARQAETLYQQLIDFPSGSHDDLVDALYNVIFYLLGEGFGSYGFYDPANDRRSETINPDAPAQISDKGEFGFAGLQKRVF